jgi:putative Mg2+ transporter-C (MgtC) family protein
MQLELTWTEVAIRLGMALLAGVIIGLDRGERGKPAGLRTTILVCLAAALSMVLANAMAAKMAHTVGTTLPGAGLSNSSSLLQLDMMRLPLGVLTGIGFIGAGTILKRGDLVTGVTTAATVWFVTMIGLCFGAGQLGLGLVALAIGWMVLTGLARIEDGLLQDRRGTLTVMSTAGPVGLSEERLRELVGAAGCSIASCELTFESDGTERVIRYEVGWRARRDDSRPPPFLKSIATIEGVDGVRWRSR